MTLYRPEIEAAAKRHGIEADLLEALVLQESSGRADAFRYEPAYFERYIKGKPEFQGKNPRRVSSSYGLCQIMYPTALQYGFQPAYEPEMLFLPVTNLDLGAKILAKLQKDYDGDTVKALQAYNGGPGSVGGAHGQTLEYAASVLNRMIALKAARV